MKATGKPYRTVRGNQEYQKGYEGGGEGVKIGTGKGGGLTQRFSCQQQYGPSTKKAVRERDKGENKKVVGQSHAQNK